METIQKNKKTTIQIESGLFLLFLLTFYIFIGFYTIFKVFKMCLRVCLQVCAPHAYLMLAEAKEECQGLWKQYT